MSSRPSVLFVTYDASRTGAPMYLLRLLRWLHDREDIRFDVLCLRGGPLVAELEALGPVAVVDPPGHRRAAAALEAGLGALGLRSLSDRARRRRFGAALDGHGPWDVVYCNGAGALQALPFLPDRPPRVVAHVHELADALDRSLPGPASELLREPDLLLAVAACVREELVDRRGVAPERVVVRPGFVDQIPPGGGPGKGSMVAGIGEVIARKGPDRFVEVARTARAGGCEADFVWVGAARGDAMVLDRDGVRFVGDQPDMDPWYERFAVLLLTSREDPFPLVCLEAGAAGVPTVAFEQGGAPEFVCPEGEEPVGRVVPDGDVEAMAAALTDLLADDDARRRLGEAARQRVQAQYRAEVVGPEILRDLQQLVAS